MPVGTGAEVRMANVVSFEVYADGSGAPARIDVNGASFAFDRLGDRVSCTCLRPVPGSFTRPAQRIAVNKARAAYENLLDGAIDAEWVAKSRAMYADEGSS